MPDVCLTPTQAALLERESVTVSEAAQVFCCHVETVRRWIRQGLLPVTRTPSGGIASIPASGVRAMLNGPARKRGGK